VTNLREPRLPNFFIVGAQKSGTTSLHHYLGKHPDIFMSAVKEPHFFAHMARKGEPLPGSLLFSARLVYTWDDYIKLFERSNGAVAIGESSTGYLTSHQAPVAIREHIPHAKIIALLRHPIDRAYSNYLMNRVHGTEPLRSFEAAFAAEQGRRDAGWPAGKHDYFSLGLYGEALSRYYAVFPADQIRVFAYEELRDDAKGLVETVFAFLGVNPAQPVDASERLLVARTPPRSQRIDRLVHSRSRALAMAKSVVPAAVRRSAGARVEALNQTPARVRERQRRRMLAAYHDDLSLLDRLTGKSFSRWLEE
jgi:hypothetical protein